MLRRTHDIGHRYTHEPSIKSLRDGPIHKRHARYARNFSANFFSSFASFGEITNAQYGCREFSL
jgi:hypothetical protein